MRFEKSLYENRFSGGLSGLSIFSRVFSAGGALRSEKTVQRFFKSLKPPEKRPRLETDTDGEHRF